MTAEEKNRIIQMRHAGLSYQFIAEILGKKVHTVKTFCSRNGLTVSAGLEKDMVFPSVYRKFCKQCGEVFLQYPDHREKVFCCTDCRNKWWNTHASRIKRDSMTEYTCPACGKKILCLRKSPQEILLPPVLYHRPVRSIVMRITEDEFTREMRYQLTMHFVRSMLLEKLISEDEFFQIEFRNRERYKPFIGILLSGKFLLRFTNRVSKFMCSARRIRQRNIKFR